MRYIFKHEITKRQRLQECIVKKWNKRFPELTITDLARLDDLSEQKGINWWHCGYLEFLSKNECVEVMRYYRFNDGLHSKEWTPSDLDNLLTECSNCDGQSYNEDVRSYIFDDLIDDQWIKKYKTIGSIRFVKIWNEFVDWNKWSKLGYSLPKSLVKWLEKEQIFIPEEKERELLEAFWRHSY